MAQFNAGHRPGASVTALCMDREKFHFLVTGDTDGYIRVWYVPRYGNAAAADDSPVLPPDSTRFQLLQESMILKLVTAQQGRFTPPADASDPDRTWSAPPLVTAFHGHLNVVTSLDYIDSRDCFVSSSDDFSLRLWTVYGAYVGVFGQDTPWLPVEPLDPAASSDVDRTASPTPSTAKSKSAGRWQPRRVPADVRRVASACSLRVMYGGHVPQWRATRAKLLAYVEVFRRVMNVIARKQVGRTLDDDTTSSSTVDVRLPVNELPPVEYSRILGNSYRRQRRYRPLPTVPRVLQDDLKVSF